MIPAQLMNEDYRFIEIPPLEKGPRIKGWQKEAAKPSDHPDLIDHIENGGNYGVVTGYGGLVVLDIDDERLDRFVRLALPSTFTVRTGSGGHHYYFYMDEPCPPLRLKLDGEGAGSAGDLKSIGGQVVGPGSIHPNGRIYTVEKPIDIAYIPCADLHDVMDSFAIRKRTPENIASGSTDFPAPRVMDIMAPEQPCSVGDQVRGIHPVHGSSTGQNLSVNPHKNVWFCFRCGVGGSGWHALAVVEGLLECHECGPGSIDREMFLELLKIAEERGYV